MALEKDLGSNIGIDLKYHKIYSVRVNYIDRTVSVEVHCYVDGAKRKDGAQPVRSFVVELDDDQLGYEPADDFDPDRARIYEALKNTPELSGASDDMNANRPAREEAQFMQRRLVKKRVDPSEQLIADAKKRRQIEGRG